MIKLQQFIITDEETRGMGKSPHSPIRRITRILKEDGTEVAEYDPCSSNVENIYDFMRWHFKEIPEEKVKQAIYDYFLSECSELSTHPTQGDSH
jgi:hypothetical protein